MDLCIIFKYLLAPLARPDPPRLNFGPLGLGSWFLDGGLIFGNVRKVTKKYKFSSAVVHIADWDRSLVPKKAPWGPRNGIMRARIPPKWINVCIFDTLKSGKYKNSSSLCFLL